MIMMIIMISDAGDSLGSIYVESWVMTRMKNITTMSPSVCINSQQAAVRLQNTDWQLNWTQQAWNCSIGLDRMEVPDYWCCLSVWHTSERQREREIWKLPRLETGVETDLKIPHSNCGASHNWCIRSCLERHREVASIAEIDFTRRLDTLQRACLLGTARILR